MSFIWDPSSGKSAKSAAAEEPMDTVFQWEGESHCEKDVAERPACWRGDYADGNGPSVLSETSQGAAAAETGDKLKTTGSVRFGNYVKTIKETTDEVTGETHRSTEWMSLTNQPALPEQDKEQASGKDQESGTDASNSTDTIPRRWNIDDAIEHMTSSYNELTRLDFPGGDTLVYIDAPPRQPGQYAGTYSLIQTHFGSPFCMRSETLRSVGSAYLEGLLGPTAQFRVLRKRGLVGKLPSEIKYVIDLTPDTEGMDALLSLMHLSCPVGVRHWGLSALRWNVARSLVCGYDDFTTPVDASGNPNGSGNAKGAGKGANGNRSNNPIIQIPDDYTPLRHRFSIERVLTGIEGLDPMLDSAVKVYTTCAVAEQLGIKTSNFTDYVVRWLSAAPNTYFTEAFPEVTLRMAECLQVEHLGRDMFALLVGEAALDYVTGGRFDLKHNVHGRKKEDLPEAWLTRIEYARNTFVDRIQSEFDNLVGPQMEWLDIIPEYRKLSEHVKVAVNHLDPFVRLQNMLEAYFRGAIYRLLCSTQDNNFGPVQCTLTVAEVLFPEQSFSVVWNILRSRERYFTRAFWTLLRKARFDHGLSNFDVEYPVNDYGVKVKVIEVNDEFEDLMKAGIFTQVRNSELRQQIVDCSAILQSRAQASSSPSSFLNWVFSKTGSHGALSTESASRANTASTSGTATLPYRTTSSTTATDIPSTTNTTLTAFPYRVLTPADASSNRATNADSNFMFTTGKSAEMAAANDYMKSWGQNTASSSTAAASPPRSPIHEPNLPGLNLSLLHTTQTFFSLDRFLTEAELHLSTIATRLLAPPADSTMDLALTNTLVCLQDGEKGEMRYLPLWAGGLDDGSAGVFSEEVPYSEVGFSTAGPRVRTEQGSSTEGSRSGAGSEWDMLDGSAASRNTSTEVGDGYTVRGGWEEGSVDFAESAASDDWEGMGGNGGQGGLGGKRGSDGEESTGGGIKRMKFDKSKAKVGEDDFEDLFMDDADGDDSDINDFDADNFTYDEDDAMEAALAASRKEKGANDTIVYRGEDEDDDRP